ncbi:hypothetical protein L484_020534 [Morus notabilis]|uniref:Uncharacterized protein n=1 Tax=Morus notabilis TaxID=981085 RepID=W9S0Q9_9ROSA|nr:hypothetical protein L484_020534 [Morus notabilis]
MKRKIGHRRSVVLVIYAIFFSVLLEGLLAVRVISSTNLQNPPSTPSSGVVFFKVRSRGSIHSSSQRFYDHGRFAISRGRDLAFPEEQKRITPNGANPLHNR